MSAVDIFREVETQLHAFLGAADYSIGARQDHGPFGSCFVTFVGGHDSIRLVWDAREKWFVLEQTMVDSPEGRDWEDIAFQRYDPDSEVESNAEEVIAHLIAAGREAVE